MEKIDFKIKSKDEAFWEQQIRVLKMSVEALEQEQINKDKMIEMDEHLIKFCEEKLKLIKSKTGGV